MSRRRRAPRREYRRTREELEALGARGITRHPKGIWQGLVGGVPAPAADPEVKPEPEALTPPPAPEVVLVSAPEEEEEEPCDIGRDSLEDGDEGPASLDELLSAEEAHQRPPRRWWRVPYDNTLHATQDAALRWREACPRNGPLPILEAEGAWAWRAVDPPLQPRRVDVPITRVRVAVEAEKAAQKEDRLWGYQKGAFSTLFLSPHA